MIRIPLRILLVEDNEFDAQMITFHIEQCITSPEIEWVSTLDDVKDKLLTFYPDLILSDYNLPTCTGLEVFNLAQAINRSIPFIFITGTLENEELAANTILAGATGFILKKNMDSLQEKLRPLFKKIVFNMDKKYEEVERIRKNKIAVNQIYQYIDTINSENNNQNLTLEDIKKKLDVIKEDPE